MSARFARRVALSMAAVGLLAGSYVNAQTAPQFRSAVNLVQLQVGVVDGDGNFFSGLRAEHFVITVNGEQRGAQVAYEVDLRGPAPVAGSAEEGTSMAPVERRPIAARRHFILFFDFNFITRRGVLEARQGALRFIDANLHADDMVAVALANRSGIDLLVPFGQSRVRARQAVEDLGLRNATDLPDSDSRPGGADPFTNSPLGGVNLSEWAIRAENSLGALEEFGNVLQAIAGRKHMVFFSSGFPDQLMGASTSTGYEAEIRAAIKAAGEALQTADVAVHSVDPRGLQDGRDGHTSLLYLSDATGGEVYWRMNKVAPALERLERLTAGYYMIGYRRAADDPPTVDIEVRVQAPGARVTSAPTRLSPPPPYAEMSDVQRQLQLTEAMVDEFSRRGIAVDARVATYPIVGSDTARAVVMLEIGGDELDRLDSLRGGGDLDFEIAGTARASDGTLLGEFQKGIGIDVDEMRTRGSLSSQAFRYDRALELPPGEVELRLVVRELEIGELTTTTENFRAIPHLAGALLVAPPLVVERQTRPLETVAAGEFDPLQAGDGRFVPVVNPSLPPGAAADLLVVLYDAPIFATYGAAHDAIAITATPGAGGDELELVVDYDVVGMWNDGASGATQILVRFTLPELLPTGNANLRVRATDPRSGESHVGLARVFVAIR